MPSVTKRFLLMWKEVTNLLEKKAECFLCKQQELVFISVVVFYGSLNLLTVSGVKQFCLALKKYCVGKPKSCEKLETCK